MTGRATPRIGVVGATGAVGRVTVAMLRERGYDDLRLFASARSAGTEVDGLPVEEATAEALADAGLRLALFSVGASASRELVPHAARGGALVVDKSSAFRLQDGIPLVVPEVNGERALEHDGVIANPNCSTIPLTLVLKPLHEAAGVERVRVATYQSASGAGAAAMERLLAEPQEEHDLRTDWPFDGTEFEEESKLRAETRKILELPELTLSATTVRVPVLVAHAEAVWVDLERPLTVREAREILAAAPSVELAESPTPKLARGRDVVLVGRIKQDGPSSLGLFLACDNLRKGAALNAIQIAELVLQRDRVAA